MDNDFKPGAVVKDLNDEDVPARKGKVIGYSLSEPGMVAVEWDDGTLERIGEVELQEVDAAMESDYRAIQEKVGKATELLREATNLASKHDTCLADLYYELKLGELHRAIGEAGWSASSMRC